MSVIKIGDKYDDAHDEVEIDTAYTKPSSPRILQKSF